MNAILFNELNLIIISSCWFIYFFELFSFTLLCLFKFFHFSHAIDCNKSEQYHTDLACVHYCKYFVCNDVTFE